LSWFPIVGDYYMDRALIFNHMVNPKIANALFINSMNPIAATFGYKATLDQDYSQANLLVAKTAFAQCKINPIGSQSLTQTEKDCLQEKSSAIWKLLEESHENLKSHFQSNSSVGPYKFGATADEESDE